LLAKAGLPPRSVQSEGLPPRDFVAMAMQVAMMFPAQRHGEFVADLASERSGLRKI
jgi:hypothetical protein